VILRFDNAGMRYGTGPEVLRDVTFALEPGSLSFLTGPSGAGKSTLLKLVSLAERPVRGAVELFGRNVAEVKAQEAAAFRRRLGIVFQDFRLIPHLDAFANVALPLRIAGQKESAYRDDVVELLKWVGLGDRLTAKPETLSGGEQQRVAIARAVVAKPSLILADEPTGNIDPEMGDRVMRLFMELHRLGTTILIATHDRALVERSGGQELRLFAGRLTAPGGRRVAGGGP
jgi:cell division transport system ATP-binding protein